jgi:hypothetical protein
MLAYERELVCRSRGFAIVVAGFSMEFSTKLSREIVGLSVSGFSA